VRWVNRLLSRVGLRVTSALPAVDPELRAAYERDLRRVREVSGVEVFSYPIFEGGAHPERYVDFECRFAAHHLRALRPRTLLDVGSYRHFVLGLSAFAEVTSVDVRPRGTELTTERVVDCDARSLALPDGAFDVVVSLSSVEHFGLGRYGDELDLGADAAAMAEMRRVLRPGGALVFTTSVTAGPPAIAFNAHRIYDLPAIRRLCAGLVPVQETLYSHALGRSCSLEELTRAPQGWDVYCGVWRKEAPGGAG